VNITSERTSKQQKLLHAKPGTKEARRLVALADAIEAYEDIHYPIDEEDGVEYVQ
jgi:antitoxin component HigA of HigAB toxin-antitoxin module